MTDTAENPSQSPASDECNPPSVEEQVVQATQEQPDDADPKQVDKVALRASQAGMRFIAQMTIYNSANWERMQQFIESSYQEEQLADQPAESRLQVFKTTFENIGRMKVKQVIATNKHHVIVVMETERGHPYFYSEMQVEDEYPHQITAYMHTPLQPKQSTETPDDDMPEA